MMKVYALRSAGKSDGSRSSPNVLVGRQAAHNDRRWPNVTTVLAALREQGRRSVRIVDADCGGGVFLMEAVAYARSLGFTAVEGRGIDGSPAMIARARATARRIDDPGVGLVFELVDAVTALRQEAEFPADIVIWHRAGAIDHDERMAEALAQAGRVVIDAPVVRSATARAV